MEHHSNIVPWQLLAKQKGAHLKYVGLTDDGHLVHEDFRRHLESGGIKLVTMTHVSNVLGTINPVREYVREAHKQSCRVLVDAAQSVPHMPVDVQDMDCDFLAFSGHKMCGPTGIGVLYARTKAGVISFNLGDVHAHDMASLLDEDGIAVRSGHHCAQPLMERLGVSSTTRASVYVYNTEGEIDRLVESVERAGRVFKV